MLVTPLTGKISLRNPPVITIVLILLNCCVFFFLQQDDDRNYYDSEMFYFDSGLARIEVTRYVDYRYDDEERSGFLNADGNIEEKTLIQLRKEMLDDPQFVKKLRSDQIITPEQPDYSKWKQLRQEYEKKSSESVTINFGFRPAYHQPVTFFTYMFLHGGFGHLFGNMIFLWLMGCMLEMGCGRTFYSVTYLSTGLGSVILFWWIYADSTTPLIGASGAISGLMGAFAVLYGLKKVRVFYSLGFYFNYMNIRAIYLLPFWVANELYQLVYGGISQVAYVGHIGGLISGGIFGVIYLKLLGNYDPNTRVLVTEDKLSPLIQRALDKISRLDLEGGDLLLEEALVLDPKNTKVMIHLFNIRKTCPEEDRFHEIAQRLLDHLSMDSATFERAGKIYDEYCHLTAQPQLSEKIYLRVSDIFSCTGHPEKAERILVRLIKAKPGLPDIPSALLKLANGYQKEGMEKKHQRCLAVLQARYPYSTEAQIAARFDRKSD